MKKERRRGRNWHTRLVGQNTKPIDRENKAEIARTHARTHTHRHTHLLQKTGKAPIHLRYKKDRRFHQSAEISSSMAKSSVHPLTSTTNPGSSMGEYPFVDSCIAIKLRHVTVLHMSEAISQRDCIEGDRHEVASVIEIPVGMTWYGMAWHGMAAYQTTIYRWDGMGDRKGTVIVCPPNGRNFCPTGFGSYQASKSRNLDTSGWGKIIRTTHQ